MLLQDLSGAPTLRDLLENAWSLARLVLTTWVACDWMLKGSCLSLLQMVPEGQWWNLFQFGFGPVVVVS